MFFFSSRRRHTRSLCDWSSDVCSSDLLLGLLIVGVPFPLPRDCLSFVQSDWFSRLSPITEEAIVLGVALCVMGRDGRESVRSSIRLPDLRSFLLAVAFPTSIDVFISSGQYVLERSEEHTSELQSHSD